jgi:hypothetical protein
MIKVLLAGLGVWSAGCGFYYGIVGGSEKAFVIGLGLACLLIPVALLLAVLDLPPRKSKRRTRN